MVRDSVQLFALSISTQHLLSSIHCSDGGNWAPRLLSCACRHMTGAPLDLGTCTRTPFDTERLLMRNMRLGDPSEVVLPEPCT